MPEIADIQNSIFEISNTVDFNELALKIFRYQASNNNIYQSYLENLNIRPEHVMDFQSIPFIPIDFFKTHKVVSGTFEPEMVFTSSGTTGMATSKHHIKDLNLYIMSFQKGFQRFFGSVKDYVIIALLPSYLEREGSSLVYMADRLIKDSGDSNSGFYLSNYDEVSKILHRLKKGRKNVLLLGVTYALLDLAEKFPMDYPELIIMETGGMKGRRKELVREELHEILISSFGTDTVFSEYGMTELLSQAYSKGNGEFRCPPWMKVIIRDVNDPFAILKQGKSGGINIIDLANIHSCSFIETKDLGRINRDHSFEILGRYDNSDIRGCNLLVI